MKYYLNGVGLFVYLCFIFGFAVPTLVSAKDTLLVMGGFALVFSAPVVVWYWLRKVFIKRGGVDAVKS
ncbi:putative membrane protein [Salmonella phage GEC_vB_MG]|nr:putative membrane protein [Salmonella phage GEC_vB_MG]UGV21693.1 hypothetical protein [Cronobacter phage EspYZU08]WAK43606.1 hypothetical protein EspYZU15_106 [Cronobacter phage EspYZU15]WAK45512.1 hypothetical protein EspYZU14_108 [Cronobacter phage EspYZU14]WBF78295.1 hypothetical protein [Cronobacter phage EspYZU12]WNT48152.1 membrane protein [Salmonella phage SPLA5a]HDR2377106.1 hypothetical protein [Enterobacter asburiae]